MHAFDGYSDVIQKTSYSHFLSILPGSCEKNIFSQGTHFHICEKHLFHNCKNPSPCEKVFSSQISCNFQRNLEQYDWPPPSVPMHRLFIIQFLTYIMTQDWSEIPTFLHFPSIQITTSLGCNEKFILVSTPSRPECFQTMHLESITFYYTTNNSPHTSYYSFHFLLSFSTRDGK